MSKYLFLGSYVNLFITLEGNKPFVGHTCWSLADNINNYILASYFDRSLQLFNVGDKTVDESESRVFAMMIS